jgi:hypothetical protein
MELLPLASCRLDKIKKTEIIPVKSPTHLITEMDSLNSHQEAAMGITSEIRWAISVFMIPEW